MISTKVINSCDDVNVLSVENVAVFIEYNLNIDTGEYLYNYIDKVDFDINTLITEINQILGKNVLLILLVRVYWWFMF